MRTITAALAALLLSACGVNPQTWLNAGIGHAAFPAIAVQVQACIADRPDVQATITPAWNRTFDKWEATKDLEPNAEALRVIAAFPDDIAEAKRDAIFIEQTIVDAGLDCGPFVREQWGNIKTTFGEIEDDVQSNQRVVLVAQWASLISAIVQGDRVEMQRMPTL